MTDVFLKPENIEKGKSVIFSDSYRDQVFIRFWSEDKIQLDGDFRLSELKRIVEVMESFE